MEQEVDTSSREQQQVTELYVESGQRLDLLAGVVRAQEMLDSLGNGQRVIDEEVEITIRDGLNSIPYGVVYLAKKAQLVEGIFLPSTFEAVRLEHVFKEVTDQFPND